MKITLGEAIEILEEEEEVTWVGSEEKWKAAVKIGYEAMKRIRASRNLLPFEIELLPGEKEE